MNKIMHKESVTSTFFEKWGQKQTFLRTWGMWELWVEVRANHVFMQLLCAWGHYHAETGKGRTNPKTAGRKNGRTLLSKISLYAGALRSPFIRLDSLDSYRVLTQQKTSEAESSSNCPMMIRTSLSCKKQKQLNWWIVFTLTPNSVLDQTGQM